MRTFRAGLPAAGALVLALALIGGFLVIPARSASADPCAPGNNPVVCENSKPGTDSSIWDIQGSGDSTIQGFATSMSVNLGDTESFKISTDAHAYHIDIYRLGYYNGLGARLITSITPSATLPQTQPSCLFDNTTLMTDCGNWAVSASWTVPTTVVSGVFIALLTRTDTGGRSQIPFIVRNDTSHSNILFKTSDATWEAYNLYGGNDFYPGDNARAYKLSYNRPFSTRGANQGRDYLFSNEYPMIRFMERNGYDVSYFTDVDTDRYGSLIKNHKIFTSTGHDEYWSGNARSNVEAARDADVNLAFFSGNQVYWKTRFENSTDGSNTAYRTLVCYKETWANAVIDPADPPTWTGTWMDPRFSPPADGGRPENALTGGVFGSNQGSWPLQVPAADSKLRQHHRGSGFPDHSGPDDR